MTEQAITIEEALLRGCYVGPTRGTSMLPMLKEGRDSIVVYPKKGRLRAMEVALYRRGEEYILHRVIGVTDEGYVMRGDNTYEDEFVPENAVIGVLSEYFRGEQAISCTDEKYLRYVKKRQKNYKIRRFWVNFKKKIKKLLKRA